jgi:hypothetical protein
MTWMPIQHYDFLNYSYHFSLVDAILILCFISIWFISIWIFAWLFRDVKYFKITIVKEKMVDKK